MHTWRSLESTAFNDGGRDFHCFGDITCFQLGQGVERQVYQKLDSGGGRPTAQKTVVILSSWDLIQPVRAERREPEMLIVSSNVARCVSLLDELYRMDHPLNRNNIFTLLVGTEPKAAKDSNNIAIRCAKCLM